jgi:hypothetical protein
MPKNDFWVILVKTNQKSNNFFAYSVHILEYKKATKSQKFCLERFIFKKVFFFNRAPSRSYIIGPSGQKTNSKILESGHLNYRNH